MYINMYINFFLIYLKYLTLYNLIDNLYQK